MLVLCDDANARDEENTRVSITRVMHGAMRRRCARANDDHAKSRSRDRFIHNHATDDDDNDDDDDDDDDDEDDDDKDGDIKHIIARVRDDARTRGRTEKSRSGVTSGDGQLLGSYPHTRALGTRVSRDGDKETRCE